LSTIIWQDGFEYTGGATLASIYGSNAGGSLITGRASGNGLNGFVAKTTGLSAGSPIVMGAAYELVFGGITFTILGPTGTTLATIVFDTFGHVTASFPDAGTVAPLAFAEMLGHAGWHYLEVQCLIAASGRIIVAIDGVQLFDVSMNTGTQAPAGARVDSRAVDDWYFASPAATPDFKGDYHVAGTPPSTTGSTPSLANAAVSQQAWVTAFTPAPATVAVSQQSWIEAHVAPKVHATVAQQYWIVAVKNKKPRNARPQVFG